MRNKALFTIISVLTLFFVLSTAFVQAQQDIATGAYYVATAGNGTQQVYQVILNEQYEPHQISYAESDVITFGVAYDGLAIAYISDGQLWLQALHTGEPEALASLSATQFFSGPVFSQDGQYIAYADNGVSLFDLATREGRQLVANVPLPLDTNASNAGEFRIYQPLMFVPGEDGAAEKLILDVGIWEWMTAGVYDLESGELQELSGNLHTDLLPLSDGRVLVYGNNGMDGSSALHIADSIDSINSYTDLFHTPSLSDATLFVEQAVENEPGIVRMFGQAIDTGLDPITVFYFDYDLSTDEASELQFISLSALRNTDYTIQGRISPDGNFIPVYLDPIYSDSGSINGEFSLLNLFTGELINTQLPETLGIFRWQE